ncbi:MAG: hypothetical protein U9O78_03195 [Patescibacteria group bacterium]|nr:hypothetical protein [Patescibacteria group bacterium]
MKNTTNLERKAIKAAKNQNWKLAIELNEAILQENPRDINALNRLALANMQLNHPRLAKRALKKVICIDKHNKIAKKNLAKISSKQMGQVRFTKADYIEEPGKAKNVQLTRLANEKTLADLNPGLECYLDPKTSYVSIYLEDNNQYIGAIPKEISQKLIKLIKTGNEYHAIIKSCNYDCCVVHVKEKKVSTENEKMCSFEVDEDIADNYISKLTDKYKVRDDIPLEIVSTDEDVATKSRKFTDLN